MSVAGSSKHATYDWYLGVSDEGRGHRAWLIQLDYVHRLGQIYLRPRCLKILYVQMTANGGLHFASEPGVGDVGYEFIGRITTFGLLGDLYTTRKSRGRVERIGRASVELQRLPRRAMIRAYSNMKYNEESGDLVGTELLLISGAGTKAIIYTSSEGGFIPYAAYDLSISRDWLRFKIFADADQASYSARRFGEKLILWREGAANQSKIVLFSKWGSCVKEQDK